MALNNLPALKLDDTQLGLYALQQSPYMFYLTGSRAFSTVVAENTDYDFFIQDSVQVQDWLKLNGFHSLSKNNGYRGACEINAIYGRAKIHVQLVLNEDKKMLIQKQILAQFPNFNTIQKPTRTHIWRLCYRIADLKNNSGTSINLSRI